ncbi:MAG: hypothetical protein RLZZ148_975 [Cyanobacteriota bacterium]|jgi:hypothetical protein
MVVLQTIEKTMSIVSFQEIIDSIEVLSLEDQDYLLELIQKRRIEKRRSEIAKNAQLTFAGLDLGTAKKGNIDDLMADLLIDEEN